MALMALAMYRYDKILCVVELTAAGLSGVAVLVSDLLYRRNISTTVKSAKRVLSGEEEAAFQAFALPVAVVAPRGYCVGKRGLHRFSLQREKLPGGQHPQIYLPQDLPPGDGGAGRAGVP